MKAGIVTIHKIHNYGSVLQAYASQVVITTHVEKASIIDYKYLNKTHSKKTGVLEDFKNKILSKGNSLSKNIILNGGHSRYIKRYNSAMLEWYDLLLPKYTSFSDLVDHPPDVDVYIVGSDQVWHPRTAGRDPTFFLGFGEPSKRRISYASSFGAIKIPTRYKKQYEKGLSNLDKISVRERSAVEIVKKMTGRNAELVLDPTLMIEGSDWAKEAKQPSDNKPYILCYGFNSSSNYMERLAIYISKKTGWKIIRINGKAYNAFSKKMEYVLDAGPREWLGLFQNARLIIGQSFHATAFAIIFQRPFISLLRGDEGHDCRQLDFLDIVSMKNSALTCDAPFPKLNEINLDPDYSVTHALLNEHRDRSHSYLKDALK